MISRREVLSTLLDIYKMVSKKRDAIADFFDGDTKFLDAEIDFIQEEILRFTLIHPKEWDNWKTHLYVNFVLEDLDKELLIDELCNVKM